MALPTIAQSGIEMMQPQMMQPQMMQPQMMQPQMMQPQSMQPAMARLIPTSNYTYGRVKFCCLQAIHSIIIDGQSDSAGTTIPVFFLENSGAIKSAFKATEFEKDEWVEFKKENTGYYGCVSTKPSKDYNDVELEVQQIDIYNSTPIKMKMRINYRSV